MSNVQTSLIELIEYTISAAEFSKSVALQLSL